MSMKMKKYVFYPVIFIILVLIGATMLFPFLWMVIGSLKPKAELFAVPMKLLPSTWMWKNYGDVLKKIPFVTFYINTAKIAIFSTLGQVITCALSAYAFAKLRFKGRDFLFMLYLATMMIPYQVTMIPQYELMNKLNLLNSHAALIILHCFSPFGVFLLRQFFVSIPDSLIEAARIDGASWLKSFRYITIPMLRPIFAFTITTSMIGVLNLFDGPQLLFSGMNQPLGGPGRSVLTMMVRFYEASFLNFEFGYGSAIAYLFFLLVTVLSGLLVRLFREKD